MSDPSGSQRARNGALERLAREFDAQFARMQTPGAEEAVNRFFELDGDELGAAARLRPIVYLDIDDVLIRWEGRRREAAPHAAEFLEWLLQHCEVRWITSWCPSGVMREDRLRTLAELLEIDQKDLRRIRNPRGFPSKPHGSPPKHHAIGFDEARPWIWIEDEHLHKCNIDELDRRGFADRHIECNTSRRPDDLIRVMEQLRAMLSVK